MGKAANNVPFQGSNLGKRNLVCVANGGSAVIQQLAGDDPHDPAAEWVSVPDGSLAVNTVITIEGGEHCWFRAAITGGADLWFT